MVELMIAATVLLVAVLATFVTQISSSNLIHVSRDTTTGMADLQAAMEEVLLLPMDSIPVTPGPYPPNVPIAAFTNLHLRNESIVPTYPGYTGGTIPDPLQIVLTLKFNDYKGRLRKMTLASMKTR
jgi:hypothetical protein